MSSLKKQLEELTNPAPGLADLEDEDFDGTSSRRILERENEDEDAIETGTRRLRQALNLDELDEKYRGSKTTRSEMFGNNSNFSLTNPLSKPKMTQISDESDEAGEDGCDFDNLAYDYGSVEDDDEAVSCNSEAENEDDNDVEDEEDDFDEHGLSEEDEEMEEDGIKTMGESKEDENAKKGEAVRAQLQLWEHIMRLTIKAHAALRAFNQLPRGDDAEKMLKESSDEVKQNIKQTRSNIFTTLDALFDLTATMNRKCAEKFTDEDDEEIESSADEVESDANNEDEMDQDEKNSLVNGQEKNFKYSSQKLRSFQKKMIQNDKEFSEVVTKVLTKWDERTKFVGRNAKNLKNLTALESSVTKQIDRIMSDKFRLLRRTQQKRSENHRLGGNQESPTDPEIFDDDDFYQCLLKEFIEEKSGQTSDPLEMSRRFIELQKLRQNKVKKVMDPHASRDRRIKFVTIPKLVNFYASRPETVEWSHERRNELFKSLFK